MADNTGMGFPQAPYAWTPPSNLDVWGVTQQGAEYQSLSNAYMSWIQNYLDYLVVKGDLGEDEADKIYASAKGSATTGGGITSWPLVDMFLETYRNVYPETSADTGLTAEELANIEAQTSYYKAQVDKIYNDIQASGQLDPATKAQLDLTRQQLEADLQQNAIENQLAKAQLGQQYNEWLSGLQASPANWMERWYGEHLPQGGARIPLQSDIYTGFGQGATQPTSWASTPAMPNPASNRVNAYLNRTQNTPAWGGY